MLRRCGGGNPCFARRGPYKGDQLSVDHIVPRAVVPELDNVIASLELIPQRMNSTEADKVEARQVDTARKVNKAGLFSDKGFRVSFTSGGGDWLLFRHSIETIHRKNKHATNSCI